MKFLIISSRFSKNSCAWSLAMSSGSKCTTCSAGLKQQGIEVKELEDRLSVHAEGGGSIKNDF